MASSSPFAPRPGCPMCGIVSFASTSGAILSHPASDPSSRFRGSSFNARNGGKDKSKPDILYRDDNFTVYEEREFPVSSQGHLVICFNLHVPSLYTLSSSDVPLLVNLQEIATRLLSYFSVSPTPSPAPSPRLTAVASPLSPTSPTSSRTPTASSRPLTSTSISSGRPIHIGFITPPFKDPKIPIGDHLHAHAYIGEMDTVKWYDVARKVVWNMGWWDVADLIAEIREQTSNNRIKSGGDYNERIISSSRSQPGEPGKGVKLRPINQVPSAGAREGYANGTDITAPSLQVRDLEAGEEVGHGVDEEGAVAAEWEAISTPRSPRSESGRPITPQPSSGRGSADGMLSSQREEERPVSAMSL